jgi:dTDP-4-dehydrorhamnose 3,5-epimerase
MAVQAQATSLPGITLCTPDVFPDPRGFFMETYRRDRYQALGIGAAFVQDNYSHSSRGTLRGLHYQIQCPQDKLVSVIRGEIYDAVVDLRRGSPTFGRWEGHILSAENRRQLFVPAGFAHGFCVVSDEADVMYKCSDLYCPAGERGLLWSDPDVGIAWPLAHPTLSPRDQKHPRLQAIPEADLFVFKG